MHLTCGEIPHSGSTYRKWRMSGYPGSRTQLPFPVPFNLRSIAKKKETDRVNVTELILYREQRKYYIAFTKWAVLGSRKQDNSHTIENENANRYETRRYKYLVENPFSLFRGENPK